MSEEREGAYWEALRLATENSPVDEFVTKAREAQDEITAAWWELFRRSTILDNLVADLAPDVEWTAGTNSAGRDPYGRLPRQLTGTPSALSRTPRGERVMEIAGALLVAGEIVTTTAIVETLQREGYEGEARNLSVSVGNVLARNDGWERLRAGEYAPVE